MPDEFDDVPWPAGRQRGANRYGRTKDRITRLITRLYAAGDEHLRTRLLDRLLRPLGSLALVGVAAGAFADFLQRRSADGFKVSLEDASRYTSDQIAELVRFVGQVSPESLQALVSTLADNPVGVTAFGASVLVLLMRALDSPARGLTRDPADDGGETSRKGR